MVEPECFAGLLLDERVDASYDGYRVDWQRRCVDTAVLDDELVPSVAVERIEHRPVEDLRRWGALLVDAGTARQDHLQLLRRFIREGALSDNFIKVLIFLRDGASAARL